MLLRKLVSLMIAFVLVLLSCSFAFGDAPAETPVQPKCIGIIAAMQNEVELLLSKAEIERIDTVGKVDYHIGTLCGQNVVIAKAGVGKVLAASGMTAILNRYPVTDVIFTGVAGGVGDETQVLDQVIATRLIQHDFGQMTADGFEWWAGTNGEADFSDCDPGLVRLAYDAAVAELGEARVFQGIIASGDQFIASETYVERLRKEFGAIACEMEGAAIAAICSNYDIPFVVIRCMSDKADGKAHDTYENLADLAAEQSSRIVLRMLEAMGN